MTKAYNKKIFWVEPKKEQIISMNVCAYKMASNQQEMQVDWKQRGKMVKHAKFTNNHLFSNEAQKNLQMKLQS